jgi:8-oxo-dGTP pyrophosphatase MutT (NUDIX family)
LTLEIRPRPVARVVVIDPQDRVLLFDTQLAYTRVWMTPGGGLKAGETLEQAAARELWEETGIQGVRLSGCVWTVRFRFPRAGVVYDQQEHYFVARVETSEISEAHRETLELTEIRAQRWWTLAEISDSPFSFRPDNLPALLPSILAGDYPEEPLIACVESSAQVVTNP